MAKKVGVILSGCGVYDGAEIHESVITMLALDRAGAEMVICAPDVNQMHVINHATFGSRRRGLPAVPWPMWPRWTPVISTR